jgi:hypothetical protein
VALVALDVDGREVHSAVRAAIRTPDLCSAIFFAIRFRNRDKRPSICEPSPKQRGAGGEIQFEDFGRACRAPA